MGSGEAFFFFFFWLVSETISEEALSSLAWVLCLTLSQTLRPKDHRSTVGAGE